MENISTKGCKLRKSSPKTVENGRTNFVVCGILKRRVRVRRRNAKDFTFNLITLKERLTLNILNDINNNYKKF